MLAQSEIDRVAEFHYASVLAGDEEFTTEGAQADKDFARFVAAQFDEAGIEYKMPVALTTRGPRTGSQTAKSLSEMATCNGGYGTHGLHWRAATGHTQLAIYRAVRIEVEMEANKQLRQMLAHYADEGMGATEIAKALQNRAGIGVLALE